MGLVSDNILDIVKKRSASSGKGMKNVNEEEERYEEEQTDENNGMGTGIFFNTWPDASFYSGRGQKQENKAE